MKTKKVISGWKSEHSMLVIVVFNLDDDERDYSGLVLLCRRTGQLLMPIFVRIASKAVPFEIREVNGVPTSLPTLDDVNEDIQVGGLVKNSIERAARVAAGDLVPNV